jgi:hypothetical protein
MIPSSSSPRVPCSHEDEDPEPPRSRASEGRWAWGIATITLLALLLRLYRLNGQSFWVDEVVTWHGAHLPITKLLAVRSYYGMAHSLYYAIMHGVVLVSDSELALRLPSALFGALSVPLLYAIGARWFDRGTGVAASILLTFSPLHLYYSQEARPYAAVLFFILLAMVCLDRAVRTPDRRWQVGFVVSTTAAFLSHPIALAFLPIGFFYVVVATTPAARRRLRGSFAALLVAISAFLVVMISRPPVRTFNPAEPPGLLAIPYSLWTFAAGFSLGPSIRELHGPDRVQIALGHIPVVALGALIFGGLAFLGALRIWRDDRRSTMVVAVWLIVPILFVFWGALATHHPFNVRYMLPALPPFLLLVGRGTRALSPGRWHVVAWVAVLGLTGASILQYHLDPRYQREDYRAAVRWLEARALPDDLLLVSAPYTAVMLDYYDPGPVNVVPFGGRRVSSRRVSLDQNAARSSAIPSPPDWRPDLDRIVASRQRFWVLLSRTFHGGLGEELPRYLNGRFDRVHDRSWAGVRLILYSSLDGHTRPEPSRLPQGPRI